MKNEIEKVYDMGFIGQDKLVLTGNGGKVLLYDLKKMKVQASVEFPETSFVYGLQCHSDEGFPKNAKLSVATRDGALLFLNEQLKLVSRIQAAEGNFKSACQFKQQVYWGRRDGMVISTSPFAQDKENILSSELKAHKQSVNILRVASAKQVLISGEKGGNVHFWDIQKNLEFIGNGVGMVDYVSSIGISPDQNKVAVGSWDQIVNVFNI